jgi:hypothetical protein
MRRLVLLPPSAQAREAPQGHYRRPPELRYFLACLGNAPTPPSAHPTHGFTNNLLSTSFTLGRTTTQIAIDLKMSLRSVQRVIHMWNEIGEVCRDRKYKGRTPLMSAAAINVHGYSLLLYAIY